MAGDKSWIVVTGATSGIGLATVRVLADHGRRVIAVGRNEERCRSVRNTVADDVVWVTADLSSLRGVHRLSDLIEYTVAGSDNPSVGTLINNAGTVSSYYVTTRDGFELQLAVNHLAPFLLTYRMVPFLAGNRLGRVINVTSGSHRGRRIRWDDLNLRRGYNALRAYRQSKLAHLLVTFELDRRIPDAVGIRCFAFDPGLVNTDIGLKGTDVIVRFVWALRRRFGSDPAAPAAALSDLATVPLAEISGGLYQSATGRASPSALVRNTGITARMWETTERMCGIDFSGRLREIGSERREVGNGKSNA